MFHSPVVPVAANPARIETPLHGGDAEDDKPEDETAEREKAGSHQFLRDGPYIKRSPSEVAAPGSRVLA